jgi:hypothetical protein
MHKKILLLLALQLTLFAYSDYDLDGVSDEADRCPNTPFSELVDANGCTTSLTKSAHNFTLIYGINFSQVDYSDTDTLAQNFQLDYYYKNFSLELSTSYYDSQSTSFNDSGTNDSFVGAYYRYVVLKNITINTGLGLILPTYDTELNNNNTDYTGMISASYALDEMNLFVGYNYTNVNDDDLGTDIIYQDTNSYSMGVGFYPTQKLYLSTSYFSSDSIYKGEETIETVSFYSYYLLNEKYFTTLSYAHGLSDSASDNYMSLRVGYKF